MILCVILNNLNPCSWAVVVCIWFRINYILFIHLIKTNEDYFMVYRGKMAGKPSSLISDSNWRIFGF